MSINISRADVLAALQDLLEVYPKPKTWTSIEKAAGTYHFVLCDAPAIHPDQLTAAVKAYLKGESKFFPTPGQLRGLAEKQARPSRVAGTSKGEYLDWENGWGRSVVRDDRGMEHLAFTACPVCGSVPVQMPRLRVVHDVHAHRRAGIPAIGATLETEEFNARIPNAVPMSAVAKAGNVREAIQKALKGAPGDSAA